ncbi:hypothetical protein AGABI2DRAFT_143965 [Agaricus bisporus var. bisporus H97]|uniref:hypothetical protein n=1 Tax=Agaricus bisporus var. bisporus (strain H97 / ATCC MYA-4626 / FGSC 10389) TaxID=936046 RepID=UPI00029F6C1D|nr:hypothetical protein AGABI2DRAFT_143965 [Agaricus bisporus var. bisporus H97]EKV45525.1 hypothetical protein AGABI2DRAFT_143965 [Agaricus bisporus var. bisporus H97]
MSTTMKGTMPDPSSKKAPRFDKRKPAKLYGFFESFEEVAKGCGLDAKEMSKAVVRYTDEKTKRYWKTLDGYDKDFGQLKKSIVGTYSKTELEPSFSVKKLVKLVEKSAKARISKDDQLSEYNRNFGYLAGQLQAARKKIRAYLEIQDQTLQRSDYPSVEKVMEAGMFLFLKEADGVDDERIGVKKSGQKKKGRKSRREETSDEESSDESELSSDEESDLSESESSSEEESEEELSSEEERKRKKKGKGKKPRKGERREVKTKKVRFAEEKKMGERGRMMEIDGLTKQLHGLKYQLSRTKFHFRRNGLWLHQHQCILHQYPDNNQCRSHRKDLLIIGATSVKILAIIVEGVA